MTSNFDNRRRAFADVVSIEAWHQSFEEVSRADLHVDVVFATARVGGKEDSPVRFRLSVKQAEVVVIIPPTEPVQVDPSTVARDFTEPTAKLTEVLQESSSAHAAGSASLRVSPSSLFAAVKATLGGTVDVSSTKKLEVSSVTGIITVTQSKTPDGEYRWLIASRRADILDGRPWDTNKQPRLKLIDQRTNRQKGIPPSVRIEIRCRREDLVIEDIQLKDQAEWDSIRTRPGFANRLVAAEAYIRQKLSEEGFEIDNISEMFSELTLGSVTGVAVSKGKL